MRRCRSLPSCSVKVAAAAAALRFRVIEREVGVFEQVLGIGGVIGVHRDTDRGARGQRLLGNFNRAIKQASQLLADQPRFLRVMDVLTQHDEFVAAEPRDQRVGRHLEFQFVRNDAQNLVTDHMALNVVDVLEVIEIDPKHGAARAGSVRALDRLGESRAHQFAVGQRRQRIVVCEE
jgi:hypothetical protein